MQRASSFAKAPSEGGEGQGAPPAKDVAEALGIAAGVQSGWLGAAAAPCTPLHPPAPPCTPLHPLILHRGRSQQTRGCQDTAIQTWNHQPPHGHMKNRGREKKRRCTGSTCVCRMYTVCMQEHKHVLLALSTVAHTAAHTATHTHLWQAVHRCSRDNNDNVNTHCCLTHSLSHNELEALSHHFFFWASPWQFADCSWLQVASWPRGGGRGGEGEVEKRAEE